MTAAAQHSDFNAEAVANMGVGMRTGASSVRSNTQKSYGDSKKTAQSSVQSVGTTPSIDNQIKKAIRKVVETPADENDIPNIRSENTDAVATNKPAEDLSMPMAKSGAGSGDNSLAVLKTLSEKQRRVFEELPLDRAVTVDYLAKAGIPFGEVISALTVLEIKGLVTSLPGALYIRK